MIVTKEEYFANLTSSGDDIAVDIQRNIWEKKHHKDVRDLTERVLERFEIIFNEEAENSFRVKPSVRKSLLALYWEETEKVNWLRKVVRLVAACPFPTVDCERNLSWLQHILDDKRLGMSGTMATACLLTRKCPDLFFAPDEKQTLNSNAKEKECLISGERPIVPTRKRIISRKGNREASFVAVSPSISPGSSSTSTSDTTLTTLATLCPSTPHLEKTSLQPSSLEGNPPETTLSENIGQYRSTRQVKKSANAVHIQNFITTERWTLEARAAALRNAEMQLISHR